MDLAAFDFVLPEEAIALRPVSPRDQAKMLGVDPQGNLSHKHVLDLPGELREGDILVLNETKVFPAALSAVRKARPVGGGGDVTITVNLHQPLNQNSWRAFVKPAKRLRDGDVIFFSEGFFATISDKQDGGDTRLDFNKLDAELMDAIKAHGEVPLPPYIARQRAVDRQDSHDYQTVYAKNTGSVAAPTAGLHFTKPLIENLIENGVQLAYLTLHVGAGTFLPVKSESLDNHIMHKEWYSIDQETVEKIGNIKRKGGRVIAVGTTSLRALESAAISGKLEPMTEETGIFIKPGYEFKVVDGLMTNFHLPRSTLFMLVCAMAGTEVMQAAYAAAIDKGYRFYSYGDSSLIWRRA